jgi:hypothetical protein
MNGVMSLASKQCTESDSSTRVWFFLSLKETSHMILTMSHWSSGLTCLLPVTRDPGSNPLGGLM